MRRRIALASFFVPPLAPVRSPSRPRRLPAGALVVIVAAALALGACSSDKKSSPPATTTVSSSAPATSSSASSSTTPSTTSTTTTPPPSTGGTGTTIATTTVFSGYSVTPASPVTCNAPTMIELKWTSVGVSAVDLLVDGAKFASYGGGAQDHLEYFACDGSPHTYTLQALVGSTTVTAVQVVKSKSA
jgi:hypothetical protein